MAELYFLKISTEDKMNIGNELRHMVNPFKVTLDKGDTHYDMFRKLRERVADRFNNNGNANSATENWIGLNEKDIPKEQLEQLVITGWDDYAGEDFYAWFDLEAIHKPTEAQP